MATTKSPTKKANTKKTRAKKAPVKSRPVALTHESASDFMTFRFTKQTLYWAVLGAVVLLFTVWILKLQSDIQAIYDQIEITQADTDSLLMVPETSNDAKKN